VLELRISGELWILYSIWDNISSFFGLDYDATQQLIKEWVEEHLKLGDITPSQEGHPYLRGWKNI